MSGKWNLSECCLWAFSMKSCKGQITLPWTQMYYFVIKEQFYHISAITTKFLGLTFVKLCRLYANSDKDYTSLCTIFCCYEWLKLRRLNKNFKSKFNLWCRSEPLVWWNLAKICLFFQKTFVCPKKYLYTRVVFLKTRDSGGGGGLKRNQEGCEFNLRNLTAAVYGGKNSWSMRPFNIKLD